MEIKVGDRYLIDHQKNVIGAGWDNQFPFECEVLEVSDDPNACYDKYRLMNNRTGNELSVEELWWDQELTGRIIKKL